VSTVTLYRPVGSAELKLIEASGWKAFPPRLPEQPIFYPVTNQAYAAQIARDWNAVHNDDKRGYVTRSDVSAEFLAGYDRKVVGGREHEEYWIPAEELSLFNAAIEGQIEVIETFVGGERFGLDGEQYEYVRQLANAAGNGAWSNDASVVTASRDFLNGELLDPSEQRRLLTDLLRLAVEDPSHEWEAPILTGQPTSFAVAALKKINETHA